MHSNLMTEFKRVPSHKACEQDSNFCDDNTSDSLIYICKAIQFPDSNSVFDCFSVLFILIFT